MEIQNLAVIDIVIILGFFAAMICLGLYFSKRVKDAESYTVADRSLDMKLMVGATVATCMGAGSALGDVGMVYDIGVSGILVLSTWNVGWIALIFLSKKIRASGAASLPEFLEQKYGTTTKTITSIILIIFLINVTAAQLAACGTIFFSLHLCSIQTGVIVGGIFALLLTVFGGLYAVAVTDTIQTIVMIVGVVIMVPVVAFAAAGGPGEVIAFTAAHAPEKLSFSNPAAAPITLLGYSLSYMLAAGTQPAYVQKIVASKDEKTAFWGSIWSNLIVLVICVPIALTAFCAPILFPDMASGEMTVPSVIYALFPPVAKGFVLAALLILVIDTADSFMLLLGTTITNDIFKLFKPDMTHKQLLPWARACTVIGTVVAVILALYGGSVFLLFRMGAACWGAGMFVPLVCACFWKGATTRGINAGMLSGCFVTLIWNLTLRASVGIEGVIIGAAACLIFTVAVSLTDKKGKIQIEG